jgi:Flp pilus assembly protein TadG
MRVIRSCVSLLSALVPRPFGDDAAGSVAMVFSLCLLALIPAIGGAIDLGNAYRVREQFLAAGDAAILDVVATNSASYLAAADQSADGRVAEAETAAIAAFYANIANTGSNARPSVKARVEKSGTKLTASVSFTAALPTSFLGIIGVPTMTVEGHATSLNILPAYIDFYLLLDNSPSMGIAATQADIDTMLANTVTASTPQGCAFACHELDLPGTDNYSVAHNAGVTTRIDVLRESTRQLMDTAAATAVVPNQYRMSISTFNTSVQSISALTNNLATAKADAAAIDLMAVPNQNANWDRDTDFDAVMPQFDATIPNSGVGKSPADPQRVVFLVTDGVADEPGNANPLPGASSILDSGSLIRQIEAFNPELCSAMKARGIKIAVMYTTYLPLPTDSFYNDNVQPWADQINPNIQACASPGLFFEVAPNEDMSQAMNKLFLTVVTKARLTL